MQALIFDLDGTLIDTVYAHVFAWQRALAESGIAVDGWRVHRRIGMSGGLFARAVAREIGREISPKEAEDLQRLGPIDLALLPIGAYEPRWFMKDIHMNPVEAVQAHLDLRASQSIAMHFGTFQLTPEGIDEPARELAKALRERGVPAERFRIEQEGYAVSLTARDTPARRTS